MSADGSLRTQVLTERYKEHSAIQSQYKNRLNRLRETLNTLMSRSADRSCARTPHAEDAFRRFWNCRF